MINMRFSFLKRAVEIVPPEVAALRIRRGLGTIFYFPPSLTYVPAREHKSHPEYEAALAKARELGVRIE